MFYYLFYFVYNYDETYKKGNGMAEKKLPTGVGKKIVEALKKQNEIEQELVNPVEEDITISSEEVVEDAFEEEDLTAFENLITDDVNDFDLNEIDAIQTDDVEITEPVYEEVNQFVFEQEQPIEYKEEFTFGNNAVNTYEVPEMNVQEEPKNFNMPSNVAVLKKLIAQLPSGVSKQTGAQIIRQTMEALGISMNSVLAEAQHVQDGLNESIKDCMTTVNEYKQNIMTLEKQVVDYQKQVKSVNDLISLFILTDK